MSSADDGWMSLGHVPSQLLRGVPTTDGADGTPSPPHAADQLVLESVVSACDKDRDRAEVCPLKTFMLSHDLHIGRCTSG